MAREYRDQNFPVPNQTEGGMLKNRSLWICINSHHVVRTLHSDRVIKGTANSDRNVEFRRDRLSRKPDLLLAEDPSLVHHLAAASNSGVQHSCQIGNHREVFRSANSHSHGDNNFSGIESHRRLI